MKILSRFFQSTKKTVQKIQEKVEKLKRTPVVEEKFLSQPVSAKHEKIIFEISPLSVVKATIVILLLIGLMKFVLEIGDILVVFFAAFLLAAGMEPAIDYFQKWKIPRGVGVILFYIAAFGVLGFVISSILPILAKQLSELAGKIGVLLKNLSNAPVSEFPFGNTLNNFLGQFFHSLDLDQIVRQLESNLQLFSQQLFALGGNLWEFVKIISNGLIHTFLVLILAFFMSVEKDPMEKFILSLFPSQHAKYAANRLYVMKKKIGHWLRAMLILMVSVGLGVYIGLKILGVEYAAVLSILAGILEIVPVLGPSLSFLFALPIVANESGWLVFWVLMLYIIIQQLEGHILVPVVMRRVVGLNSIIVIFALLVGARFLGVLGIVLSIPVATMVSMFLEDYLEHRAQKETP